MSSLNISAIDRQARQMRAEEMQRIQGIFTERLRLYGQLLAATFVSALAAISAGVRPLFSWNPQELFAEPNARRGEQRLLTRINRVARGLFSWNPQARRA